MQLRAAVGLTLALLWASPPAQGAEITTPGTARDRGQLLVSSKAGVFLPQLFSPLETSYLVELELGYVLPTWHHHLMLALDCALTDPRASGQGSDTRLESGMGSYRWSLEARTLIVGLTFFYRHPIGRLVPYVGIGPRFLLLDSEIRGQAGDAKFLVSKESAVEFGFGLPLGLTVRLGPGALVAEISLIYAPAGGRTTGNFGLGGLSLALGYQVLF